ncbi:MAG: hypothetical protein VX114_01855 [Chloroflexota bacterium]|nr:hypothetical protein [Chloroflexota bacterium]
MKYEVLKLTNQPIFSTVQDEGRIGYEQYGVPNSGAGDKVSYRLGNLLLGNNISSASIEILYGNASFECINETQICITGSDMQPKVNGIPLKMWQVVNVCKGDKIDLSASVNGLRSYIAVKKGIEINEILDSKSTHSIFKLGGKKLKIGDIISATSINKKYPLDKISLLNKIPNFFEDQDPLYVTRGPEYNLLNEKSKKVIENQKFKLSNRMSRTGAQVEGNKLQVKNGKSDIISDGVSAGTIQLPKDGNMYVLLEDSQRIGGYARILNFDTLSLYRFSQLKPGDEFKLKIISIEDAHERLKKNDDILFKNNIYVEKKIIENIFYVEGEKINVKIFGENKEHIYLNNKPLKIDF